VTMVAHRRVRREKGTSVLIKGREDVETTLALSSFFPTISAFALRDAGDSRTVDPPTHRHPVTLFSFGPRSRIPWKIISCVNGRLVLSGVSRHSLSSSCLLFLPSFLLLVADLCPPFCPSSIRSTCPPPKLLSLNSPDQARSQE